MGDVKHTHEFHDELKRDPVRFRAATTAAYMQDDGEERLECRNCTCGSTLALAWPSSGRAEIVRGGL
jgi:hypothetical protein